MKKIFLILASQLLVFSFAQSQIISPSGVEVQYQYTAKFQIPKKSDYSTDVERAEFHASHLFGLFHSPHTVSRYGLLGGVAGGIGAPRSQMNVSIVSSKEISADLLEIEYKNLGRMILNKTAAEMALREKSMTFLLPTNPMKIYNEKCTDDHYTSFGDYWYFYDIYKQGCEYLTTSEFATETTIQISATTTKKMETTLSLPKLRGDNGNGDLFSIAIIQGFADSKSDLSDSGRINYKETYDFLKSQNFKITDSVNHRYQPMKVFTKTQILSNGKLLNIEVKLLLVETSIGSRSKIFAQFFKDAVQSADVIIYGGHSGLGGNLDIPSLESKVGKFEFNKNKKQIFYFDSCSSYSYYLEHFKVQKTKAKIDIMSNGLSSYFHTARHTTQMFLGFLFSPEAADVEWSKVLSAMEDKLDGDTYLLSVGAI